MKIKQIYKDEFKFLKEKMLKQFLIQSLIFLLICIIIGILVSTNEKLGSSLYEYINEVFKQLDISPKPGLNMMVDLFLNNTRATAQIILLGLIPFLFLPIFSFVFNAVIIGAVVGMYPSMGFSITAALLGIIPHGIFELPAMIYSMALGIYLNISIIKKMVSKDKKNINMKEILLHIVKSYIFIIIPLLLIASIIEAFITPIIITWALH